MRRLTFTTMVFAVAVLMVLIITGFAANKEALNTIESQKKQLQASQNKVRELEGQIIICPYNFIY